MVCQGYPCFRAFSTSGALHNWRPVQFTRKSRFVSHLLSGVLTFDDNKISLTWDSSAPFNVTGGLAESGRGMELSELVVWRDKLMAFDDRTGIMFELVAEVTSVVEGRALLRGEGMTYFAGRSLFERLRSVEMDDRQKILRRTRFHPIARSVMVEGNGITSAKGMKIEWAAEKDDELFVGSFGKEYTSKDGKRVLGHNNLWVLSMKDVGGVVTRHNWTHQYNRLREETGTQFPGYLIHEAASWSPLHRKRVSTEAYDEEADEKRGGNKILWTDEDFTSVDIVEVKFPDHKPERGFSSFKFVPGTNDEVAIAIRSAENEKTNTQETHISVFNVFDGSMILHEEILTPNVKYEGIEIF